MQITDSSEMENRMDDSNSTAARSAWDGVLSRIPWVETCITQLSQTKLKKAGFSQKTRLFRREVIKQVLFSGTVCLKATENKNLKDRSSE